MKISFNPSNSNKNILDLIKNNKDIIFDLKGHSIFARGVEFKGTDTNTWRDIKINNVSIGSHTLDLRNGSNTTLTNTNGVVTINSTWRPVVDNLTSDSTTSSLSAKQGKVLKALIDGKSNSDHNHDGRYLKLTGGTMASNALITFADSGSWDTSKKPQGARGGLYWTGQSDYAKLYAEETVEDNLDLVIQFGDDNSNGLSIRNKANTQTSYISSSGVITTGTFKGNLDWSYITNKPSTFNPAAHTHTVFKNNLMIKGTNGISDSASIHLGIGDSDTGFNWISDGVCQIYADNVAIGQWTSGGMNWFKNLTVNGNKVWNAGNDGSGSGLDADTVDGYHAASFVKMYTGRFNQYNKGTWTKILQFTISSGHLDPTISFIWHPTECARDVWADFNINIRSDSPIFYVNWKGTTRRTVYCVGDGTTYSVWVQGTKSIWDPFGLVQVISTWSINTYQAGNLQYSDSEPTGTYKVVASMSGIIMYADRLLTPRNIWGQSFDGTRDISGTLSGVANIQFSADDAYDIGSNSATSRYIYTHWLGAKSGSKLELGANNSGFGQGLCIDTDLNVGIGTNSPTQKLDVIGNIRATGQLYLPTNGNYNAILMGDDCWMGDCNISNVIGLSGTDNANSGGIKFGKGGMYIGYNGSSHYSSGTSLWTNFNADTVDGEHASNFSYTHQSSFDFSKRKSGRIVTFDQSGTDYGWINGFASTHNNYLTSVIFNEHKSSNWYVGYMEGDMSTGETNGLQAVHKLAFADGDESYPIFLGYLNLYNGNDGTISSSFPCLGYSVPFTYTRGGAYCLINIPNTSFQTFYIKAAIASVHYSGAGMDNWVGNHRGDGAWWLHCDAVGSNTVQVKGFHLANGNNDSWWGGNPLYSDDGAAKIITVCLFGYVKFR